MHQPEMVSDAFAIGFIAFIWFIVFWVSTPRKKQKPKVYDEVRIVKSVPAQPKQPKPVKPAAAPAKPKAKPGINPDTLKAMHIQADAERKIGEALWRKAERTPDPVKRARLEKQAATSDVRFNNILDRIDKLTSSC